MQVMALFPRIIPRKKTILMKMSIIAEYRNVNFKIVCVLSLRGMVFSSRPFVVCPVYVHRPV